MALGRTYSVALVGLNGYIVEVEADIGQPSSSRRHIAIPLVGRRLKILTPDVAEEV